MKVNWNLFSQNIMQYILRTHMMRFRVPAVLVKMGLEETVIVRAVSDEKIYLILTKYSPSRVKFLYA